MVWSEVAGVRRASCVHHTAGLLTIKTGYLVRLTRTTLALTAPLYYFISTLALRMKLMTLTELHFPLSTGRHFFGVRFMTCLRCNL
jgi:hypothetical protein